MNRKVIASLIILVIIGVFVSWRYRQLPAPPIPIQETPSAVNSSSTKPAPTNERPAALPATEPTGDVASTSNTPKQVSTRTLDEQASVIYDEALTTLHLSPADL